MVERKYIFSLLYRSPAHANITPEFETLLQNFHNLLTEIKGKNPYSMLFTRDFNSHTQLWWPGGDSTREGDRIEDLTTFLGLSQLITEPTNFEPHKHPSCIDLIFTDQPNLVLESRTRTSLDPFCHHQMTHCRFNLKIQPPPFTRNICSHDKVNHFRINPDSNWQVNSFIEIVLNIMSNFIPNNIIKIIPTDPPWINNVPNRHRRVA